MYYRFFFGVLAGSIFSSLCFAATPPADFERAIGKQAIAAVVQLADLQAAEQALPDPLLIRAHSAFVDAVSLFNPIEIGRSILNIGRKYGASVAVAMGVWEVSSKAAIVYALKYPVLAALVPLTVAHVDDFVVFGLAISLQKAARMGSLWIKYGGPLGYYRHLLQQRQSLPWDWDVMLDMVTVDGVTLGVIEEGWIERHLPRLMRMLVSPRKLALRERVPVIALWEAGVKKLEKAPFKEEPELSALLDAPMPPTIENLKELAATPDLVAQRLLWALKSRRDQTVETAGEENFRGLNGPQRKWVGRLRKLLDQENGLAGIMPSSDWQSVRDALYETQGALHFLASLSPCEVLLESGKK